MTVPVATLFMLMSVDGKISTGTAQERDFDKDLPAVPGVAEGLHQYSGCATVETAPTGRAVEQVSCWWAGGRSLVVHDFNSDACAVVVGDTWTLAF